MGRNFSVYWPRPDAETPAPIRAFLHDVAREYYGDAWDPERGVVRASSRKRLRESVAPIGDGELSDPLIRHFVTLNPHHRQGDMLVCLAPLTLGNWKSVVGRAVAKRVQTGKDARRVAA